MQKEVVGANPQDKLVLAGCVIPDSEGKILLIHRNTPKRVQWETPGGKVDSGETPRVAAVRELKEELGADVEILRELGRREFFEDGFAMEYVWFLAKIVEGQAPILAEKSFDKMGYFSLEAMRQMEGGLSPNAANLLNALLEGEISLD